MPPQSDQRTGLVYGTAAYVVWGLLPLYWHLLGDLAPAEILAHRMAWSLPVAAVILACMRRWSWIPELVRQPRRLGLVLVCATVISVNWFLYIWAVNSGHVLEASLGYFINRWSASPSASWCCASGCGRCSGRRSAWAPRRWS